MLSAEDNRLLTESGVRHADGRAAAAVLAAGGPVGGDPRARRDAQEDHRHGRGPARLPRHQRPRRHHRPELPAPRRQSLARPQRGVRHPLRLSRLEVRRGGALRRHADLLSRRRRQGQDAHQGLSRARAGRDGVGLHGAARAHAGAAGAGGGAGAAVAPLRHQEMAGLQLGAGHGGQHRHGALLLRAPHLREGRARGPRHRHAPQEPDVAHELRPRALDCRRPAPRHQGQPARCRPRRRRRAHRRRRQHLLAHRPVPDARARLRAERHARREHVRADVRAGQRHHLLDLHLRLEPRAAHQGGRARPLQGRQRRHRRGRRELCAAAPQGQRLPDRPPLTEDDELHRHQGGIGAGRRRAGQPGPDRRPHEGAPGPHRHRHPALPQAHDGPGARPHARQGAAVGRLRRALPGARRRLHHAQVQGPRHRHDRALRRSRGLRRRSTAASVAAATAAE